ncbi:MAG: hypothetical protein KGS72_23125 [Cyanobacteria bacterium REEB67]|nr:hypothetical protein [Cyanobacteria bacterium REEB67]
MPKVEKLENATPLPATIGYPVTPLKFWLMSILTCSLFNIYWAFQNFRRLDTKSSGKTIAAVSSIFLPLCFNDLLKGLNQKSSEAGVPTGLHNLALSWAFFLLTVISKVADKSRYPLIGFGMSIAATAILFIAQKKINSVNAIALPGSAPDGKFSPWDIIGMVLGGLLLAANLVAILGGFH